MKNEKKELRHGAYLYKDEAGNTHFEFRGAVSKDTVILLILIILTIVYPPTVYALGLYCAYVVFVAANKIIEKKMNKDGSGNESYEINIGPFVYGHTKRTTLNWEKVTILNPNKENQLSIVVEADNKKYGLIESHVVKNNGVYGIEVSFHPEKSSQLEAGIFHLVKPPAELPGNMEQFYGDHQSPFYLNYSVIDEITNNVILLGTSKFNVTCVLQQVIWDDPQRENINNATMRFVVISK